MCLHVCVCLGVITLVGFVLLLSDEVRLNIEKLRLFNKLCSCNINLFPALSLSLSHELIYCNIQRSRVIINVFTLPAFELKYHNEGADKNSLCLHVQSEGELQCHLNKESHMLLVKYNTIFTI